MELSYGSEFNKADFEKRIKMIEDYDGSLADRSPYENWEQVNIEKLALENQKKKRVKSIDSRRAYASYKHLRGRHDQRDHAWNRGMGRGSGGGAVGESGLSKMIKYQQTRQALLEKVRTGDMTRVEAQTQLRAMRDTLGDISPTRREEFAAGRANAGATQAVADAPAGERTVQEVRGELQNLYDQRRVIQQQIDGINARNSAAITSLANGNRARLVNNFFTTALMVMLENTDNKYNLSMRLDPHLKEISEAHSSLSGRFINQNDIGVQSRMANLALIDTREMKRDGTYPRYSYESYAQRIMSFLAEFNYAIDAAGFEVLDNQPDFTPILNEATFVKSLTSRESTPATTMEELILETNDFNSSYDILIDSDMVSDSEKQILQAQKKIANDFVEQTRNEIVNSEAVSASLAPQLQQLNYQIATLLNEMKNITPDIADTSEKYSNNPIYREELFSEDAKRYSQKAAEVTKRLIDKSGGKFDSIATELSLNLDNPQDIEILSDLLGVFIDPTDNPISQTNMSVNLSDANENISYAADIKNGIDETVITSSRYISYDANDDSIEIGNNIFKQKNLSGIGYAMRVRQVAAAMEVARRTGRKVRISTYAVSNGVDYFGFHVWPKLGYDFRIPSEIQTIISDLGFYQTSTNELMLSDEKAESESGQYSQFDGMTPLQFWAELVDRAGGDFGENGYITIEPDSQEEQLLAIEAQVLQKYTNALARKQQKTQKSYSKSTYNKYLETIGFSADELDMFDEAWESVRKSSTKKPKKEKGMTTQTLKHLRGRHDQLDHAWNRGMGGGAGAAAGGAATGGLSKMMKYRETRAALLDMVRTGDMTRKDAREQLRAMRDTLGDMSPTRREEFAVNRANTGATEAVADAPAAKRTVQVVRDEMYNLRYQRDNIQEQIANLDSISLTEILQVAQGNRQRLLNNFSVTGLMTILENTDSDFDFLNVFLPHLGDMSEGILITNRMIYHKDSIKKDIDKINNAFQSAKKKKEQGVSQRSAYENNARTVMDSLNSLMGVMNDLDIEILENKPGFREIIRQHGAVLSSAEYDSYPVDNIEKLIQEANYFNSFYNSLIYNDIVSDSEKQTLQKQKQIANDFVEQTKNMIENNKKNYLPFESQLRQVNEQISELMSEMQSIDPYSVSTSGKYSGNPIYREELFSADAKNYSEKAAKATKRMIDDGAGAFDAVIDALGLDVDKPTDVEILSDLLCVFVDPTENPHSQMRMGKNNYIADDNISYNSTIENEFGQPVIYANRYMTVNKRLKSITIQNSSFRQDNLTGIGYVMRARQMAAAMEVARRTGYNIQIETLASSDGYDNFGFHVWPKLGYKFPIPDEVQEILVDLGFKQQNTDELMLSNKKAKSVSGRYSQLDGMTPLEFWANVVTLAGGDFGVNGYIHIEPKSQEEQLFSVEAQILQKYSDLLEQRKNSGQKSYSKSAYNKYLETIGFSADELDMFDEAWESVRKSLTKKPKKEKSMTTQTLKHLRGRHDQLDHAWNRGMGGGAAGGAATGGLSNMMKYRQTRQALLDMVRTGEMTRKDAREQLRAMRDTLGDVSPNRREEFASSRAIRTSLGAMPSPNPPGFVTNTPFLGELNDIRYAHSYFQALLNTNMPNMPTIQRLVNSVRQKLSNTTSIPAPTAIPQFTPENYNANAFDYFMTITTRGENLTRNIPHTIQPGGWMYSAISADAKASFQELDKNFGITTWQFNDVEDKDLTNEIMQNRRDVIRIKGRMSGHVLDYASKVDEFMTLQSLMENLTKSSQFVEQARRAGVIAKREADTYALVISEIMNLGVQELPKMEKQIADVEKKVNKEFSDLMNPIHGSATISPAMMRFLNKHFGKSINKGMQTKPFVPKDILVSNTPQLYQDERADVQQLLKDSNEFINAFIDKRLLPSGITIAFDNREKDYFESPEYSRSGATDGRITVNRFGFNVNILLHEYMHAITDESKPREHGTGFLGMTKDPDITRKFNELVYGFFKHRFDKNNDMALADDGFMWAPDDFPDYYAGTIQIMNGDFSPVELVSMGVSMMLADPIKFAKTQPDYFRFLSVLLSGAWIK
jgi:citrate lyase gamma subunit